jgi:hypothetical protein
MRRRSKAGVWIAAATMLALAAAAIAGVLWHRRSGEPTEHGSRQIPADGGASRDGTTAPPGPAPTGAYASGGRPRPGSDAVREGLRIRLPRWVVALDRWSAARHGEGDRTETTAALDSATGALLTPALERAIGEGAMTRLRELLHQCRRALESSKAAPDHLGDSIERATVRVNGELAARDLGYVLDSDLRQLEDGRLQVLLFSFTVERVTVFRSGTRRINAFRVRRLDKLNWSYNLLGFASPLRKEALVILDQVDDRLLDRLLPLLATDPPPFYELDPEDLRKPWHRRLHQRVVAVTRAAYGHLPGIPAADLTRLGSLLARRKGMFAGWIDKFAVAVPATLQLRWNWREELAGHITGAEMAALGRVEQALAQPAMERAFAAARDRLASTIERHEVQHRLDHLRSSELPLPPALRDFVGAAPEGEGHPDGGANLARAELSAYLAELSRDPLSAAVGLAIITQFAVDLDYLGSPESYAAIVLLEGLAQQMGVTKVGALVHDRKIDRARVTQVFIALTDAPRAELRAAAARLWERFFGGPLPPLTWAGK